MEDLYIKQLDHHDLVMGVIKYLGVIDHINARLGVRRKKLQSVNEWRP